MGEGVIPLEALVVDSEELVEAINKHGGEVEILYLAPSASQLATIALWGGTGRLEDYGADSEVNASIHQRNLAVCHAMKTVYDGYMVRHIATVKEPKNEDELRKLGPPRSPYEMPAPAGATEQQVADIFRALDSRELDTWSAIAHQLDEFANRLSQGYPYLRIKPKFVGDAKTINKITAYLRPGIPKVSESMPVEVEVETNFDIQYIDGAFHTVVKSDALVKVKIPLGGAVERLPRRRPRLRFLTSRVRSTPTSRSCRSGRHELSPTEKVALVNLGFYAYEDYRKLFGKLAKTDADPELPTDAMADAPLENAET